MVLVACEASDNHPSEAAGRLLCSTAALPSSTFLVSQRCTRAGPAISP